MLANSGPTWQVQLNKRSSWFVDDPNIFLLFGFVVFNNSDSNKVLAAPSYVWNRKELPVMQLGGALTANKLAVLTQPISGLRFHNKTRRCR